jgi:protein phosphatase
VPALSLVALVGSADGRAHARSWFDPSEHVGPGAPGTDAGEQDALAAALRTRIRERLAAGVLTALDAGGLRLHARAELVALAKEFHATPVAIVLAAATGRAPEEPAGSREDEPPSRKMLEREGFRVVHVLEGGVTSATLERTRSPTDRREERGPFDLIGDVHGCLEELVGLLGRLGYVEHDGSWSHPRRRAVFLGDLVDRGPASLACLTLAKGMVERGRALMVPGNHEAKLVRALRGKNVRPSHGLARTLAELDALEPEQRARAGAALADFIEGLASHLVLDDGRLVAAHAGMRRELQRRDSGAVRAFALYGETTGEVDAWGLPVRADWALAYRGEAAVVYGHTPVPEAQWVNDTICIDTGCVFGGKLTALRWPERVLVEVPATRTYHEPARPLARTHLEAAREKTHHRDGSRGP